MTLNIVYRTIEHSKHSKYALGRRQVPFEEIRIIELIGEGGQGAVYKGSLDKKIIALKRFSKKEETENYHLLVLDHPNLIRFLSVICICFL